MGHDSVPNNLSHLPAVSAIPAKGDRKEGDEHHQDQEGHDAARRSSIGELVSMHSRRLGFASVLNDLSHLPAMPNRNAIPAQGGHKEGDEQQDLEGHSAARRYSTGELVSRHAASANPRLCQPDRSSRSKCASLQKAPAEACFPPEGCGLVVNTHQEERDPAATKSPRPSWCRPRTTTCLAVTDDQQVLNEPLDVRPDCDKTPTASCVEMEPHRPEPVAMILPAPKQQNMTTVVEGQAPATLGTTAGTPVPTGHHAAAPPIDNWRVEHVEHDNEDWLVCVWRDDEDRLMRSSPIEWLSTAENILETANATYSLGKMERAWAKRREECVLSLGV